MSVENQTTHSDNAKQQHELLQNHLITLLNVADQGDSEFTNQSLRHYADALDSFVVNSSIDLNHEKDLFLDEVMDNPAYQPTNYHGFHPVSDENYPAGPSGVGIRAVEQVQFDQVDMYHLLANIDSLDSLITQRDLTIQGKGHLSNKDIVKEWLGEVYVPANERLRESARAEIHRSEELYDHYNVGFNEYVHSQPYISENESSLHQDYVDSLKSRESRGRYTDALVDKQLLEHDTLLDLKEDNLSRSPISVRKNYEQLLYGLFDQDSQAVVESGMKQEFEFVVDDYFAGTDSNLYDLYQDDGTRNPPLDMPAFEDFINTVSADMGFSRDEVQEIYDAIRLEERMFLEYDIPYASRQEMTDEMFELYMDLDKKDTTHKHEGEWLIDGFEAVYGQPLDYNIDSFRQQHEEESLSEEEFKQMADDLGYEYDTESSENLFDVDLNLRMDEERFLETKEVVSSLESTALALAVIIEQGGKDEVEPVVVETFNQMAQDVSSQWRFSKDEYQQDPELFEDWLSTVSSRTIQSLDPTQAHDVGYTAIQQSLGTLDDAKVADFIEHYEEFYAEPIDAGALTVDEVYESQKHRVSREELMLRNTFGDIDNVEIDGLMNYRDYLNADRNELSTMREEIRQEAYQEIEEEIEVDNHIQEYDDGPEL